ncbi:MAG TPA: aroma-sacti cluster domain-containing protein [Chloroflexota bacterium]|jgi:hypothetical protein
MATGNSAQRLRDAGWPIDKLPEAQQQVLAELSAQEVDTMIHVRERLTGAGGDVQAYRAADSNGIFYY